MTKRPKSKFEFEAKGWQVLRKGESVTLAWTTPVTADRRLHVVSYRTTNTRPVKGADVLFDPATGRVIQVVFGSSGDR